MAKKLTNGKISIGAYMFPDRKKPCLCVEEGNQIFVYGHFNTVEGADKFIDILGKMVGATFDGGEEDGCFFENRRLCPSWCVDSPLVGRKGEGSWQMKSGT